MLTQEAFEVLVATAGNPGPHLDAFDQHLNLRYSFSLPSVPDAPGDGHLAVNRMTLREILLSGLEDSVHFGSQFTHYTAEESGTVTAHFADGSTATGDLLVGADGVNSTTRNCSR